MKKQVTPADFVQGAVQELTLAFEDRPVVEKPSCVSGADFVHHLEMALETASGQVKGDQPQPPAPAKPKTETVSLSPEASPQPSPQPSPPQPMSDGEDEKEEEEEEKEEKEVSDQDDDSSRGGKKKRPRLDGEVSDQVPEEEDVESVADPVKRAELLQARVTDTEKQLRQAEDQIVDLMKKLKTVKDQERQSGKKLRQQEQNIEALHAKQDKWLKRCEELRDPILFIFCWVRYKKVRLRRCMVGCMLYHIYHQMGETCLYLYYNLIC